MSSTLEMLAVTGTWVLVPTAIVAVAYALLWALDELQPLALLQDALARFPHRAGPPPSVLQRPHTLPQGVVDGEARRWNP